jgi:hypothetical protein
LVNHRATHGVFSLIDTPDDNVRKVRSLRDALRQVRTAETERSDVVVELRDAERARLELLADDLRGVFAEVPPEDEQFIFTVAPGTPPRLWIDMTAFVVMGRDRRTYRFLKDTRLGRTVIVESDKLAPVADTITHYVAERIIERERAVEGDWLLKRILKDEGDRRPRERSEAATRPRLQQADVEPVADRDRNLGWVVAAFLAGIMLGGVLLLAYAWVTVS